jgi:hypothetical protein
MRWDHGGLGLRSVRERRENDSLKHREREREIENRRSDYNVNNDYNRQANNEPNTGIPHTHTLTTHDNTKTQRESLYREQTGYPRSRGNEF